MKTTAVLIAGFSVVNLGQGVSARSENCDDPDAFVSLGQCITSQKEGLLIAYTVFVALAFTLSMMAVLLLEAREAMARHMSNSFSKNHFETVYFEEDTGWCLFVASLLCVTGLAAFLAVCCFLLYFEFDKTPAIAGICLVVSGMVVFAVLSLSMLLRKSTYSEYAQQFRRKRDEHDTPGEVVLIFEKQLGIARPPIPKVFGVC